MMRGWLLSSAQTQRYWNLLLDKIAKNEIDPSFLITCARCLCHSAPLRWQCVCYGGRLLLRFSLCEMRAVALLVPHPDFVARIRCCSVVRLLSDS
jgi:hypothetical protein